MQPKMKEEPGVEPGLLKKTVEAGAKLAQAGVDATRIKATVTEAVEDGMVAAKRAMKKGRYAAEDLVDEAAYAVKHDPLRSVAITFGVGLILGTLVGFLTGRKAG